MEKETERYFYRTHVDPLSFPKDLLFIKFLSILNALHRDHISGPPTLQSKRGSTQTRQQQIHTILAHAICENLSSRQMIKNNNLLQSKSPTAQDLPSLNSNQSKEQSKFSIKMISNQNPSGIYHTAHVNRILYPSLLDSDSSFHLNLNPL